MLGWQPVMGTIVVDRKADPKRQIYLKCLWGFDLTEAKKGFRPAWGTGSYMIVLMSESLEDV